MFSLLLLVSLVSAYSFSFTSQPRQCANLSLEITGSGKPPYTVLLIPYGPTPLANNVEARTILSKQFPGDDAKLSFQLTYPANSQFVAVVSDSTGFGTGGTSVAANVMNSSDTSCFNATASVSPLFTFNINPANQVVQCSPSRLWWDSSQVQGTPNFQGVIPGGESFSIPVGTITNKSDMGTGFSWTPTTRAGTTLMLVAGDGRGVGAGGSDLFTVSAGLYPNSSCITNTSPSSTAGSPAGGSYPTDASGSLTGTGGASTGAIVGGVIGGLALIVIFALVAFYIIRRKTGPSLQKERPVNLLHGDPDDNEEPSNFQPPPYLQPDPYLVTAPTISSVSARPDSTHHSRPGSALLSDSLTSSAWRQSTFSDPASATADLDAVPSIVSPGSVNTTSRKSAMQRQLRAVNIIQHEDAGPSGSQEPAEPEETIELPPAYTHIRKEES